MAYVNKHVIMSSGLDAPDGHTQTAVVPSITDFDFTENKTINVACSGIVAATAEAGFDALFTALEASVESIIGTDIGIDSTGNSVDYVYTVNSITNEDNGSKFINDANRNYSVVGKLQVKVY